MKTLLLTCLLTTVGLCAEWNDPTLPQASPSKPVYQWTGWPPPGSMWLGGKCYKVRIPSTDDLKKQLEYEFMLRQQEERLAQVRVANRLILWGFLFALGCAVFHGANSVEVVKNLLSYGIGGGILAVVGGVGYKWFIANEVALGWICGIAAFTGVSLWILSHKRIRDWSVSRLIKGKKK